MKAKKRSCNLIAGLMCVVILATAQVSEYECMYPGAEFFSDGQEWILDCVVSEKTESKMCMTLKVEGSTMINGKHKDVSGKVVDGDVLCKKLVFYNGDDVVLSTGAYEILNELYVFSQVTGEFVSVVNFNLGEGESVDFCKEEYKVERVDFAYDGGNIRKRIKYVSSGKDSSVWVYGIGFNRFHADKDIWGGGLYIGF